MIVLTSLTQLGQPPCPFNTKPRNMTQTANVRERDGEEEIRRYSGKTWPHQMTRMGAPAGRTCSLLSHWQGQHPVRCGRPLVIQLLFRGGSEFSKWDVVAEFIHWVSLPSLNRRYARLVPSKTSTTTGRLITLPGKKLIFNRLWKAEK